jgi:hypothetical protein
MNSYVYVELCMQNPRLKKCCDEFGSALEPCCWVQEKLASAADTL